MLLLYYLISCYWNLNIPAAVPSGLLLLETEYSAVLSGLMGSAALEGGPLLLDPCSTTPTAIASWALDDGTRRLLILKLLHGLLW